MPRLDEASLKAGLRDVGGTFRGLRALSSGGGGGGGSAGIIPTSFEQAFAYPAGLPADVRGLVDGLDGYLYLSKPGDGNIYVVEKATGTLVDTQASPVGDIRYLSRGATPGTLWVGPYSGSFCEVDLSDLGTALRTQPLFGTNCTGMIEFPDELDVGYVFSGGTTSLYRADPLGVSPVDVDSTFLPRAFLYVVYDDTLDKLWGIYSSGSEDDSLYLLNRDGSVADVVAVTNPTNVGAMVFGISPGTEGVWGVEINAGGRGVILGT